MGADIEATGQEEQMLLYLVQEGLEQQELLLLSLELGFEQQKQMLMLDCSGMVGVT